MKQSPSTALKIALVIDDGLDSTDGVQQYVLNVGAWLAAQGHQITYLAGASKRKDLVDLISLSKNIRVRFNGNYLTIPLPASRSQLRRLLEQRQFDVIHVQMPYSPLLAGRIVNLAPATCAVIGTFHIAPLGRLAQTGSRLLGLISLRSSRRFDSLLAVSEPAKELAQKVYSRSFSVLGNTFDYQSFARAKAENKSQKLRVVFLGRLVPRKGCQTLIEAVAILERSFNAELPFEVVIAGDGPLKAQLVQTVTSKSIRSVRFEGFISEQRKPSFLASADIAVFPSIGGESFGFVLLEAMANGHTAVLAADNPGYSALLSPIKEALFPINDAVVLAEKLHHLIVDKTYRQGLAATGQKISASFEREAIGAKLLDCYKQALLKRKA